MPFREVLVPYEQQPQEHAEIDWGNPLTKDIKLVWLPRQILTPYGSLKGVLSGADASTTPGQYGLSIDYNQSGLQVEASPLDQFVNADQTYLVIGAPPPAQSWCVGVSSGSGAFRKWSGNYAIHIYPSGVRDVGGSAVWSGEAVVMAQLKADLTGARMFVRGVQTTNPGNASSNTFTANVTNIFQSASGDRSTATYWDAKSYLAIKWERYLTDEEIRSLSANPWQIFRPQRIYVPIASTGGVSLLPSSIPSSETFGTAAITRGNVSLLTTGIVSAESFGTHVIGVAGGPQILSPTGIASAMAFGSPQIALGSSGIVVPGVGSGEAFGTPTIGRGLITVIPSGIASAQMFGTPGVLKGTLVIYPGGIPSGESFGIPALVGGTAVETQAVFYVRGFSAFGSRRNS